VKRRWKVALGLLVVLAALLAVNTVTIGSQIKAADVTAEGGRVLRLSAGDIQVTDSGPPEAEPGQPIVLIHPYAGSLHWFDLVEPLLAERHRVIRIDLLGFGGSEKPESGYSIEEQAALVAEALNELDVQGALVAGNSMGGMVTASLAEQASQLVDRAVLIGMAPNTEDFGRETSVVRDLSYLPVIGEAMWRVTPDFVVRDGYEDTVTNGFELGDGFDDAEQPVDDFRAMTYTSYNEASEAAGDYVADLPLDERFKQTPVPLLVVFGAEDEIFDAEKALEGFSDVPGVEAEIIEEAGHAPQVEKPLAVSRLIERFAAESTPPPPEPKPRPKPPKDRKKQDDDSKKRNRG